MEVQEAFAQFRFSKQQKQPLALTEETFSGMFEHEFVGVRREKSSWFREPGSWWGARKLVFRAGRGDLAQQIKPTLRGSRKKLRSGRNRSASMTRWYAESDNIRGWRILERASQRLRERL